MSAALQIFYTHFDAAFFELPPQLQARVESKIDQMETGTRHLMNRGDRRTRSETHFC